MLDATGGSLSDQEVVSRVRSGDTALFEVLMRRYNQRLFRIARAIVRDAAEAEDVMQQAYVNAFVHLEQFAERAQFSTWLTRIAIHEALARRRRRKDTEPIAGHEDLMDTLTARGPDPEGQAYSGELRQLLERSVDALPEPYRLVFVLRDIEGLSTAETADALEIGEEAVKTRLHRSRALLRRDLYTRLGAATVEAFSLHLSRCDVAVSVVFSRIASRSGPPG